MPVTKLAKMGRIRGDAVLALVVAAAIMFGSALGVIAYRSYNSGRQRAVICVTLRELLIDAKKTSLEVPVNENDPNARDRALRFYDRNIKRLKNNCGDQPNP